MKTNIRKLFLSKNLLSKKILKQPTPEHLHISKVNKTFQKLCYKKLETLNNTVCQKKPNFIKIQNIKKKNFPKSLYKNGNRLFSYKKGNNSNTILIPKKKRKPLKFNINPVKNNSVFEQIIEDIGKIKIKTNVTLEIIKKNIKISNEEISKRTNQLQHIAKLIKNTKSNSYRTLFLDGNKINNNSYETKNNFSAYDINLSIDNNSKEYSKMKINQDLIVSEKPSNLLGIIKIPSISLNKIQKKNVGYDINDKMFHYRNFNISEEILKNKCEKLLNKNNLKGKDLYIKEKYLQLNDIINKINLLLDNINYFKSNYMYKGIFYSAFDNMENKQKAEFNLVLEEICVILITIVPKLLKKFYDNLDKLLYVDYPNIYQEMEKDPSNEKECLNYNYSFFNIVTFYFLACAEILKEIEKRNEYFKYTYSEYVIINNYLNLARYNSCKINSIAKNHILKTIKDKRILEKFEVGLGIKKKRNNLNSDMLERYYKRQDNQKIVEDTLKLERINLALNLKHKSYSSRKLYGKKNRVIVEKRNIKSLLNNPLVLKMMKYFQENIKSQIISQQVIERYKGKEENDNKIHF